MFDAVSIIEHLSYPGLFILFVLGVMGFPFPEDAILVLSGFLSAHHFIEPIRAFGVVYCSLLITDFFLFSIGRKYGRRAIEHKRFWRILSPNRLSKLEQSFKRWGSLVVFTGRQALGVRAQIFLVAGMLRMSPMKFLVADAVSALLSIAVWGGIGYVGGNSIEPLGKDISRIGHIVIAVLLLALVMGMVLNYFSGRRNREVRPVPSEPLQRDPAGS